MANNQEKLDALWWNLINKGKAAFIQGIANAVWSTRFTDPNNPKETIAARDWLVYSNLKAGNAATLAGASQQLRPEDIAAAIPDGIAESVAQLLAERLAGAK